MQSAYIIITQDGVHKYEENDRNVHGNVCRVRVNYWAWGLAYEKILEMYSVRVKRFVLHTTLCLQFFMKKRPYDKECFIATNHAWRCQKLNTNNFLKKKRRLTSSWSKSELTLHFCGKTIDNFVRGVRTHEHEQLRKNGCEGVGNVGKEKGSADE